MLEQPICLSREFTLMKITIVSSCGIMCDTSEEQSGNA